MGGGAVEALFGGTFSGEVQLKKHPICFNKVQMVAPRNEQFSKKNQFILDIWKYGNVFVKEYMENRYENTKNKILCDIWRWPSVINSLVRGFNKLGYAPSTWAHIGFKG